MQMADQAASRLEYRTLTEEASNWLKQYLVENDPVFEELEHWKAKGWSNPKGDKHFNKQRNVADQANNEGNEHVARVFFQKMVRIGDELEKAKKALSVTGNQPNPIEILDICMAPGGYTHSALKYNPGARAYGITLPLSQGGHKVLLDEGKSEIQFMDVTTLAKEYGVERIPESHPDRANFTSERPFLGKKFQLIFCDGQVLRTHARATYREASERFRLDLSQTLLALQRISTGGTIIMLMHKVDGWGSIELINAFRKFATVETYKPRNTHASRSSFYLIAKNLQPESNAAKLAVEEWKSQWKHITFDGDSGTGSSIAPVPIEQVRSFFDEYGREYFELARPVWKVQSHALSHSSFVR